MKKFSRFVYTVLKRLMVNMSAKQKINGIIYGDQDYSVPPHLNLGAFVLQKILAHDRQKAALINGVTGEKICYKELAQMVVNIATSLTNLGIANGDVVAIFSENRIECILTLVAALCSGATVTFLNCGYSKDDLMHAINISKPTYMFLSGEMFKKHFATLKMNCLITKYILYDDPAKEGDCLNFKELKEKHIDINTYKPYDFKGSICTSVILYSSGTTGPFKGAKISHKNILVSIQRPPNSNRKFTVLTIAPWSSTMGLISTLHEMINGKTLVFLPKFNESLYLSTIEKYKVNFLIVAPPLLLTLYKSKIAKDFDLSSVKMIYAAGAPVNPKNIRELKARFPHIELVLQGYGMTEASGPITDDLDVSSREGSVGRVIQGCILKVVDPDTEKILSYNEPGEVYIKGPIVFEGYVGRDNKNEFDRDGFYRTGDVAYYDEDGYFYIIDRIKELIKYKGWQVSPSELEALILPHPAVKDVGVIGAPDTLAGELPTAFIVKQPNANVTEQEIIDFVSAKVSPWKRLRGGVVFLNEIPKTASGKILRRKLRELIKQNHRKLHAKL